jgi:hypothetical protein
MLVLDLAWYRESYPADISVYFYVSNVPAGIELNYT